MSERCLSQKQEDKNAGARLWSKSKTCCSLCDSLYFPLFRFLSHPLTDPVPLSSIPAGKLDFCATVDQGPHSVLKDSKRLFLYDNYELTFSQGRGTGWGHWTRIPHPPSLQSPQPAALSHQDRLPCASAPVFIKPPPEGILGCRNKFQTVSEWMLMSRRVCRWKHPTDIQSIFKRIMVPQA